MLGVVGMQIGSGAPRHLVGQPPMPLLRLHRHSLINLLVLGGSDLERESVARAFHRESPLRSGPFVRLDCSSEEKRLCRAIQGWMSGAIDSSDSSLMVAARGTLFLDNVECLSPPTQRLLFDFVTHFSGALPFGDAGAWSGRLATGSGVHLGDEVAADRFLEPLYDCLDKARIELDSRWHGGVA